MMQPVDRPRRLASIGVEWVGSGSGALEGAGSEAMVKSEAKKSIVVGVYEVCRVL
jgi:hypothetical protein